MNWFKKLFSMFKNPSKEKIKAGLSAKVSEVTKADVKEILTKVRRARDSKGRYKADDPSTPENEAFETVTITQEPDKPTEK